MKFVLAFYILVCFVGSTVAWVDYCKTSLCGRNVTHVACNSNKGFESGCKLASEINLDEPLQRLILQRHNLKRSQVARGKLPGFPTALKMLEMTWDSELAYIAGFNARTCVMKHDACRATAAFPYAGQNLAKMGASNAFLEPNATIIRMVDDLWFGEYKDCPVELVKAFKGTSTVVGHFTAMIQQKSGRIGCAMTQFKENDKWFMTLLTCNYSFTNMWGEQIYAVGEPCGACDAKCSSEHPGLCVGT